MTDIEYIQSVANVIASQLGGTQFEKETGALFEFALMSPNGNPMLVVKLPENRSGANRMFIEYERGEDTYRVIVSKVEEDATGTAVYDQKGIYCDMLQDVFSNVTGIKIQESRVVFG